MNFTQLLDTLVKQTVEYSLSQFAPELALCGTIILLLVMRLISLDRWLPTCWVAIVGTFAAFLFAFFQFRELQIADIDISETFFTGLLVYDKFTVFFRLFILLFLVFVIVLTILSGIPDNEDGPDFYTLLLGSAVGMMLMASANNLLMVFLGIEMASVPSYAMVGFLKGRRLSSEASLKFVIYGAGAAGVMLYGISLIAGTLGTLDMQMLASNLNLLLAGKESVGLADPTIRTLMFGVLMVMVGLAFKLSVVPFHFWCPDAFEGAAAEVAGYLSVASKAAAFALLVRFTLSFVGGEILPSLQPIYLSLGIGIGLIAALTATFGNLAAYTQNNVKRLLAYSTIAHAGYMLMAVSAMIVLLTASPELRLENQAQAQKALEGLLYYLAVYLFMNLGAFAVVALIRNQIFSENLEDYKGLVAESPTLCICMLVCLFSLVGIPPFGGFVGKLFIFASLYDAGSVHPIMYAILVIGGLNTVFSLFYYLRVLKAMFLDTRPAGARRVHQPFFSIPAGYAVIVSAVVLLLGIVVQPVSNTAWRVAGVLFR